MNVHIPDCWVVIHIKAPEECFKVLAGWRGSYLGGNSWRMNSGITEVEETENHWIFKGHSGSVYRCPKNMYGFKISTAGIWHNLQDECGEDVALLDEETNWSDFLTNEESRAY